LSEDKTFPISVHWSYQAAVDAAARDEISGHARMVVCFMHSMASASRVGKAGLGQKGNQTEA